MAKGKAQKKQEVNKIEVRQRTPGVSKGVVEYIETLVDPYGKDPVHVPSRFPYRRTNVKETKQLNLKDFYVPLAGSGGECFIEIYPTIAGTIAISANNSEPETQTQFTGNFSGIAKAGIYSNPSTGAMTRRCMQPLHTYHSLPAFRVSCAAATSASIWFQTLKSEPPAASYTVQIYAYDGSHYNLLGTQGNLTLSSTTGAVNVTFPAGTEAISFDVHMPNTTNSVKSAMYEMGFTIGQISAPGLGCPNTVSTLTSISMDLQDKINDLESYSVSALACLLTYEGSDLANGGKVYSAVVPTDWQPTGDIVTSMSTIAYDRYDGPLKDGTHVHWFPGAPDEIIMTTAATAHPQSKKIVIFAQADDRTQSTRLRLTQHQQYYSQSPSYGNMTYGPSSWSLSTGLQWLVRSIPLCTSNDKHHIRKALAKVAEGGRAGLRYALKNPEIWSEFAALLA